MNLEKEMQKLNKRTKNGDVTLQKHFDKMSDIMRLSAKEYFLTKENKARKQFEWIFDFSCRQAEKQKRDLWEYLSAYFMLPEEGRRIKPPNKLKNKKEIQDWIKKEFQPYFYECMLNTLLLKATNKFSKVKAKNMGGATKTLEITKPRSAARKAPIIKERKKLIDNGVTNERVILKRIRKAFPGEHSLYIQQTILAEKYKEADERRLARTGF